MGEIRINKTNCTLEDSTHTLDVCHFTILATEHASEKCEMHNLAGSDCNGEFSEKYGKKSGPN